VHLTSQYFGDTCKAWDWSDIQHEFVTSQEHNAIAAEEYRRSRQVGQLTRKWLERGGSRREWGRRSRNWLLCTRRWTFVQQKHEQLHQTSECQLIKKYLILQNRRYEARRSAVDVKVCSSNTVHFHFTGVLRVEPRDIINFAVCCFLNTAFPRYLHKMIGLNNERFYQNVSVFVRNYSV
jgi:hypothetical protein